MRPRSRAGNAAEHLAAVWRRCADDSPHGRGLAHQLAELEAGRPVAVSSHQLPHRFRPQSFHCLVHPDGFIEPLTPAELRAFLNGEHP